MHDTMQRKTLHASGVVTRSPDGEKDEQEYIKVPISSTAVDRDGDEFSRDGLDDLRDQIKAKPRPVFENHGRKEDGGGMFGGLRYDWKDIIGSLDDAEVDEGADKSDDGESVDVLNGYIRPNPENERGTQLTRYVKEDMPVGFSVGFGVAEKDEKDAGGYIFHSTDLMEVSSVGIQSNRESVATNAADTAVAMAKRAGSLDADLDESTLAKAMVEELLGERDDAAAAHKDPTGWVKQRFSGTDDGAGPDMTEDNDDNELLERLVSLAEDAAEERSELKNRLDALQKEDDEDDDDEDDDEDEDEDGKSSDVDLAALESEIAELREALGDVEAEESETKSTASDGEGESTTADTDGGFEL